MYSEIELAKDKKSKLKTIKDVFDSVKSHRDASRILVAKMYLKCNRHWIGALPPPK